jgi:hypothetical protein
MPNPRKHLVFLTLDRGTNAPYIDLQLRFSELAAIGRVTSNWAFLEFAIRRETLGLAHHLKEPNPKAADDIGFKRRVRLWKELSERALQPFPEELRRARGCIARTQDLAEQRHKLTHWVIEIDPMDRDRLKAYPRETLGGFGWPLNVEKIEQLALDIARLNYAALTIHVDPRPARGALQRKRDTQDQHDSGPARRNPDRHRAKRPK